MVDLYLAHPTQIRHSVRAWEKAFEKRTGINLVNPFYDLNKGKEGKRLDIRKRPLETMKKTEADRIRSQEMEAIKKADGLIAFLTTDVETFGTPMELFFASHVLNKPCYSLVDYITRENPWIVSLSKETFRTPNQLERYLVGRREKWK